MVQGKKLHLDHDDPPNHYQQRRHSVSQDFVVGRSQQKTEKQPKIIKRYGNRKLYDTEQSAYVVLNDIAAMIRNKEEVRVIDNETKDDITNSTLTQIIFGAEKKSRCCAPVDILKNIITCGDGSLSNFLAQMGLFTPVASATSVNQATAKTFTPSKQMKSPETVVTGKKAPSLEDRIVSMATASHEIVEENELPELPKANNVTNTES